VVSLTILASLALFRVCEVVGDGGVVSATADRSSLLPTALNGGAASEAAFCSGFGGKVAVDARSRVIKVGKVAGDEEVVFARR
jgi:hypothetical protein